MTDMTDATPTIEEMVAAVRRAVEVEEEGRASWPPRSAMSQGDLEALQAAAASLSSLSPLIEAARRVKSALECIGPLPGASDAQVRELKEATGAMMRALSTLHNRGRQT